MSLINAIPFDGISIGSDTWRAFQMGFHAPMRTAVNDDGLIYTPVDNGLKVTQRGTGANMSVDVSAGGGWANGLSFWSTDTINLAIASAHATYTRLDYIVVRADFVTKEARLYVKQGVPAAAPVEPVLDKAAAPYYEVPLALITVGPAVASIVHADINDRREFINGAPAVCRMVKNTSGQTLYPGQIVAWNDWSPTEVILTTTPADPNTAGLIASIIPNNGLGLMTVQGIGLVRLAEAKGTGTRVGTSSTAGLAAENALNYIATLLESPPAVGAAGRCWVDLSQLKHPTITMVKAIREQTTLTSFFYMNDMSATFTMRRPGKVMITCRGILTQAGTTPTCELAAAIDGQTVVCYRGSGQGYADYRGYFSFTHIFDDIYAGAHTAGLKWRVTGASMTGYLEGGVLPGYCQIEVL